MTVATQMYFEDHLWGDRFNTIRIKMNKELLGVIFLVTAILFSACAVVYVVNYERNLFSSLEDSAQTHIRLSEQHAQLLVERSTWSMPARIQDIAQNRFGMALPAQTSVIMVNL